jgi:hypothetical protein
MEHLYGCKIWSHSNRRTYIESEENIGRKRDEVTGGFRTVHNEQLYNLYLLPNVIKVIKSRSMR